MHPKSLLVLPVFLLILSCGGGGGVTVALDQNGNPVSQDLTSGVRKPLDASNAAIERAKIALASAPKKGNQELVASLSAAQTAVQEVIKQQQSVSAQLDELALAGKELQKEKATLIQDKVALQRDKDDLEKREKLFSTGFYALLITALVGFVGVIGKFPMMRLDMQLKRLEIKERELKLKHKDPRDNDGF